MDDDMRLGRRDDRTRYVVGFCFNETESRVVLIAKNREPHGADMIGTFNGIGGRCKSREPYLMAQVREFNQEAGVIVPFWDVFAIIDGDDWRLYCFRVSVPDSTWRHIRTLGASPTDEMVIKVPIRAVLTGNAKHVLRADQVPSSVTTAAHSAFIEQPEFYPDVPALVAVALNSDLWVARAIHVDRRAL